MPVTLRVDTREWQQLGLQTMRLATSLNIPRREALLDLRDQVRAAFYEVYLNQAGPDHQYPTFYRGAFGRGLVIKLSPNANWLIVQNKAETAIYAENGRGPGGVNRAAIRAWAAEKLGIEDQREVSAIIRKIALFGTSGGKVMERAFSRQNPMGRVLSRRLLLSLQASTKRYIEAEGWKAR